MEASAHAPYGTWFDASLNEFPPAALSGLQELWMTQAQEGASYRHLKVVNNVVSFNSGSSQFSFSPIMI